MRRTAKTPPKKTRAGEVAEAEQLAGWLEMIVLSMSVVLQYGKVGVSVVVWFEWFVEVTALFMGGLVVVAVTVALAVVVLVELS